MWLQALLSAEDITTGLTEVTPLRIALDNDEPDRYLWLAPPSSVSFVDDRGVRIVTRARLQWDLVGIPVPLTLQALSVLLLPTIEQEDGQDVLSFRAQLEGMNVSLLPSMLETSIIERVNAALDKPAAALTWRFMQSLDFSFAIPASIQPLKALTLNARWGAVRVSQEGLSLAVAFGLRGEMDAASAQQAPSEVSKALATQDTPAGQARA